MITTQIQGMGARPSVRLRAVGDAHWHKIPNKINVFSASPGAPVAPTKPQ